MNRGEPFVTAASRAGAGAEGVPAVAACAGDFGITRARDDERDAKTPWSRTVGILAGDTSASSQAMNPIGVMTRWVRREQPGAALRGTPPTRWAGRLVPRW